MQHNTTDHAPPIIHARLPDGTILPVLDVTNPAFRLDESAESLTKLSAAIAAPVSRPARAGAATTGPMPHLLKRMFAPSAQYLDGLATYLLKLGADNLPTRFDTEMERRLASSPNAMALRIRLQQVSRLMAQALKTAPSSAPLRLLAIGGGTAIEALNALIIFKGERLDALPNVQIDVLDVEDEGVLVGSAILAALYGPKGRLAGVSASMTFVSYTWDQPQSWHPRYANGTRTENLRSPLLKALCSSTVRTKRS